MEEFRRLTRLPAYVFNITSELKAAARKRGEDIIDFGMGNPDGATPKHIVDKLIEAAQKTATHRYSLSRGLPRLRRAICNWYQRALCRRARPRDRSHRHYRLQGRHRAPLPRRAGRRMTRSPCPTPATPSTSSVPSSPAPSVQSIAVDDSQRRRGDRAGSNTSFRAWSRGQSCSS